MRSEWDRIARENAWYGIASWDEFADASRLDEERFWRSGAVLADNLLDHLGLADPSALVAVEIGCGNGRVTHRLAERCREVWALDISPEMISRGRRRWAGLANVHWTVNGGADLEPVPGSSVDVVLSFIVLHHVIDPGVVLGYVRDTARVLRPGGLALLHVHTVEEAWVRRLARRVRPPPAMDLWWDRGFAPRPAATPVPPPSAIVASRVWTGGRVAMGELQRTARAAGLVIERVENGGTFWTFLTLRRPH